MKSSKETYLSSDGRGCSCETSVSNVAGLSVAQLHVRIRASWRAVTARASVGDETPMLSGNAECPDAHDESDARGDGSSQIVDAPTFSSCETPSCPITVLAKVRTSTSQITQ